MRILAIADIHGMYDKFIELLRLAEYDPSKDRLILLGDYIDRGLKPLKVIDKVMELTKNGAVSLMGNHERMFLDAYYEMQGNPPSYAFFLHLANGGEITWKEFRDIEEQEHKLKIVKFLESLPLVFSMENFIFVHAGYKAFKPGQEDLRFYLWAREQFLFSRAIPGKTVVFGHSPTFYISGESRIWYGNGKIGIDCGAVYGGRLACLELPGMKEYYV